MDERVVVLPPPVVDEVQRRLQLVLRNPAQGPDLPGVDDRRVQPRLHRFRQEHRVQHAPRRRLQPERHVRDAQDRVCPRKLRLHPPDRLERRHRVAPQILLPAPQRERKHVEQQVARLHPVPPHRQVVDAVRHAQLPVDRARLPLLVDHQCHRRRPEPLDQWQQSRDLPLPVLQVDRVHDPLAAVELQCGLDHRHLGRVEHERQRRLRAQLPPEALHVGRALAPHVVDHQVEHVRPLRRLLPRQRHRRLRVLLQEQLPERPRPRRVHPLPHHQERRVLLEGHARVERAAGRLDRLRTRFRLRPPHRRDRRLEVLRRRAAAPRRDARAQFLHKDALVAGELRRREWIAGLAVADLRQPRVRSDEHRTARVLREVAHMLHHLLRTGRAVDADHIDRVQRLQRCQRAGDVRAQQHRARRLNGHARDHGQARVHLPEHVLDRPQRRLRLEQVLARLDLEHIDAALDQPPRLLPVALDQFVVVDVPQRGQLRSRPHRPEAVAGPLRRRELVPQAAELLRREPVDLAHAILDVVLGEHDPVRPERGRVDRVAAGRVEAPLDAFQQLRLGDGQVLVAAVEPVVVLGRGLQGEDRRPNRTRREQHLLAQPVQER